MQRVILMRPTWALTSALLLLTALLQTGCETYRLQGRIVPGQQATIEVLDKDDPRLQSAGLELAQIEVVLDPQTLNRQRLANQPTDAQGGFSIPVKEFGAGALEYQVLIIGRAPGYRSVWETIQLPSANKRLLITMPPGKDAIRPPEDLIGNTLKVGGEHVPGR